MLKITFPDGNIKEFEDKISGADIAKSISISLAKSALAIKIDGELRDLSREIEKDCQIEIITPKSPEALELIRHDAAHIMAEAVKELYPNTQVTIGPAIENGFYYDFSRKEPFSTNDLEKIEAKMREIVKRDEKLIREVWNREDAIEYFAEIGEKYKAEIISEIPAGQDITLYRQGEFADLCRGPHAPSTGHIKHFKLMKVAGAYWRGDSNNEMLQRIYGTAWESKESLKQHLHMLEEAQKRDHRKLGKALDLFHIQEEAAGSIFWHDKGYIIYREIENYIRNKLRQHDYQEVKTPQMIDKILWEKSGHWEKFRENMFVCGDDEHERELAIKPMNCPAHVQIFNQDIKSYRQLPLRMAEFGCCHRNESSGSLHGLMRVRQMTQDDAHIFCEESQINDETIKFCELLKEVYRDFGFNDILVKFSTRPEVRAGSNEVWDRAESALESAVKAAGLEYEINAGEGAFYGPKLEFVLLDAIGRHWQCGTLQVDFILPERLDANYIDKNGNKQRPVMLHRAILGSLERFIGILIENYAGKMPFWLSPVQIMIATITNESDDYARKIHRELKNRGYRAEIDLDAQKINAKIREHSLQKIPYILAIGKKEAQDSTVSVRKLGEDGKKVMKIEEFLENIEKRP